MRPQGYSSPFSPSGRASLVDRQPHHIGVDAIRVMFECGEDTARSFLPEPLEPVRNGLGYAYVADMTKVSDEHPDQAFDSPARTQYGEGIIAFYCRHGDTEGFFSSFIWVTEDWSLAFGHFMGWPKKLANVSRTRINPLNPAMRPLGPGSRLSGLVDRQGQRLFRIGVEVEQELPADALPGVGDRCFMVRHFPRVGPEIPQTKQLVSLRLSGVRTADVHVGRPFLEFYDSDNEELSLLRDAVPIAAHTYRQGWTTTADLELIEDLTM